MPERIAALAEGMRRIHAHREATRLQRLRWYVLEPIGWAQHTWETRPHRTTFTSWIMRAWRWRVEVRPVRILVAFTCWYGLAQLLTPDRLGVITTVLHIILGVCAAVMVLLFVSIRWDHRRARQRQAGRR